MNLIFEPLDEAFGNVAKVRALRVLCFADKELTTREISERTGISRAALEKPLEDLGFSGFLNRVHINRRYLYSLNRQNLLVKDLIGLFERELERVEILVKAIEELVFDPSLESIAGAYLVGGNKHVQGSARTDLDLLVLVHDHKAIEPVTLQLAEKLLQLRLFFGAFVTSNVVVESELARMHIAGDELMVRALSDHRLLRGPALDRLIRKPA
jgi:predicted transcriptional regulator